VSRYGSSPKDTFTTGSLTPQYLGLAVPGPFFDNNTYPTEYFLVQALSPQLSVLVGKFTIVTIADQTLFGNSYKYYFANFNLNKDPLALNFYNTTTIAAPLVIWTPANWLTLAAGVLDANSQANNFDAHAFDDLNLYGVALFSYKLGNLPGQFQPQVNWTNKQKIDLSSPFGLLSLPQIPQAVGVLLGSPLTRGLPINYQPDSWATIANFSQYLFVLDDPETIDPKIKSGYPLQGIGVFGRLGYAPEKTNRITGHASVALFARGLLAGRNQDSFGAGFYYNWISSDLKDSIKLLTAGTATAHDEKGFEIFYDFALTPAIRLIPSYQHIWNPLAADVSKNESGADVFLARVTVAF
jgi:porin